MNNSIQQRVVVTGMGVVSAAGNDLATFWQNISTANSGIAAVQRSGEEWCVEPGGTETFLAAQVDLAPQTGLPDLVAPNLLDNFSRFALHAARQALTQAGIALCTPYAREIGVILGTAAGGDESHNHAAFRAYVKRRAPPPQAIIRAMNNAAASAVTMAYGLQGPTLSVVSACASGTHAIGQAYQLIRCGMADCMLAGGSEQLPALGQYRAWQQLRVLSKDGCRPFCATRNGMILGEGAGVLLLESLSAAQARGAPILGEIAGFGMNAAASDWLRPDVDSMARCIGQALRQSDWPLAEVGFINAHGTGTPLNDSAEAQAILQVFGTHAPRIPVSSSKAVHGHALGASGALECIATLLSLAQGRIIPNGKEHQYAPDCVLDIVHGSPREHDSQYALSHSFAFGGLHAVLALARHVN